MHIRWRHIVILLGLLIVHEISGQINNNCVTGFSMCGGVNQMWILKIYKDMLDYIQSIYLFNIIKTIEFD